MMICQDCQGRGYSVFAPAGNADDTVVLHLTGERRLLLRQELYHAVHTLEAQARQASPRGNRQRAEHLRAVADQLA